MLIGIALHVFNAVLLSHDVSEELGHIGISISEVETLKMSYTTRFSRTIATKELESAVNNLVNEKILVQEAIRLGIHKNDAVVRERISKNLNFLSRPIGSQVYGDGLKESIVATDLVIHRRLLERMKSLIVSSHKHRDSESTRLAAYGYYLENTHKYIQPTRYRLRHSFLPNSQPLGNTLTIKQRFIGEEQKLSANNLVKILPIGLVERIKSQESPKKLKDFKYKGGVHSVEILEIIKGEVLPFDVVKDTVKQDYQDNVRQRLTSEYVESLRPYYSVSIEALDD